jgi:uncharacterized protein
MHKWKLIVAAIIASSTVSAATITNRGLPDVKREYFQRVNCHNSYDYVAGQIAAKQKIDAEFAEWAKQYKANAAAGIACPEPTNALKQRAINRIISTQDGAAVARAYADKQKDAAALAELGFAYFTGSLGTGTAADGLPLVRQAADLGDPAATYVVGTLWSSGMIDGTKNHKKGYEYIEKAAGTGHIDAQFRAGILNDAGVGTKKDLKKAYAYFEKAARGGHLFAATMASIRLSEGNGVKKNTDLAYRIALAIVDEGEVYGMALAAVALANSPDANKKEKDILYWLDQTAKNGNDQIKGFVEPTRAKVVTYFQNRQAAANYSPSPRKICPMKTVCTVNHYSGLRSCTTSKDYWNDCDG